MAELKNKRHEVFCRKYILNFNAAASWRDARGGEGRPTPTDRSHACEVLAKPNVKRRIAELIEERNATLKVDADWVLQRLLMMLRDLDPAALYDDDGRIRPIGELPLGLRQAMTGVKVQTTGTVDGDQPMTVETTDVRWTKATEILALIGKHVDVKAFLDRHEHEVGQKTLDQLVEESRRGE